MRSAQASWPNVQTFRPACSQLVPPSALMPLGADQCCKALTPLVARKKMMNSSFSGSTGGALWICTGGGVGKGWPGRGDGPMGMPASRQPSAGPAIAAKPARGGPHAAATCSCTSRRLRAPQTGRSTVPGPTRAAAYRYSPSAAASAAAWRCSGGTGPCPWRRAPGVGVQQARESTAAPQRNACPSAQTPCAAADRPLARQRPRRV
jgi:hypothetical protein